MTTQEQIDANLEQFEQMIRDLLELGYSATTAVQIAYKHFPIMELLEEPLTADMVQNFDRGYHSVLIPNNGTSKKPTFSTKSISEAMRAAWTSDGLNLSQRLHGRSKKVKKEVGETIAKAIKEGKNTVQTARAIFSGYGEDGKIKPAELPKYIQKVRKLRAPDYTDEKATQEYKKVLRSTERKIQQNTTPALRAAYSELVTATEEGSAAAVSKAVTVAVQEKARYNAERIARTENARAYADGQMLRYLDDEDVVALKWRLGSRHPRFDICDFYANADLYGLGKGVYPKDKFPRLPAHPHCMCKILPVYDFEIDISKAKDNVEEGGKAYISSLTKREQENLLGIHGRTMVIGGKESWTQRARGWSGEKFEVRRPIGEINQAQPKIVRPKGMNKENPYLVDDKKINSHEYRKAFESLPNNRLVNDALHREAINCFNATNGKNIERVALIDSRTGQTISTSIGGEGTNKVGVAAPNRYIGMENSITIIHNHPNNSGFSRADILAYINNSEIGSGVVVTGTGRIYSISNIDRSKPIEKLFELLYNQNKEIYGVHIASDYTLQELHEKGLLIYEKRHNDVS